MREKLKGLGNLGVPFWSILWECSLECSLGLSVYSQVRGPGLEIAGVETLT